jgi:excisionase family DNA binding protein
MKKKDASVSAGQAQAIEAIRAALATDPNGVYSRKEAALELDVGEKTVDRLIERGELTAYYQGSRVKITKASVAAYRIRLLEAGPKPKRRGFWGTRLTKADWAVIVARRRAAKPGPEAAE